MTRLLILVLALGACGSRTASAPDGEPTERPALAFTDWTEQTELFVELPALVVGEESPFAAHVTRLADFAPLTEGRATAVLRGPDGREERFPIEGVLRPGIFRPVVTPGAAGPRTLSIEVESGELRVVHDLGTVEVYADDGAAREALGEEGPPLGGRIAFLKEQQWTIDFGTSEATVRELRASLRVFGRIEARPEGDATVRAPVDGRIVEGAFPVIGAHVERDATIASLAQRLDAADRASLDLALASARMDVAQAERERGRLDALRAAGAIPERRVLEAQHVQDEARAALTAAARRLSLFERALRSGGGHAGALPVRAPIEGDVVAIVVGPGALVAAGDPLFRIIAPGSVWLSLDVPEGDLARLGATLAATFRVPGEETEREAAASTLVSRGLVVDPETHTSTVRFALEDPSVPIGMHVEGRLFTGVPAATLAVPWSAVLDDGGMRVVYVQVEGEAFERRVVRLGVRDGDFVGVTSGLSPSERVVSRGALAVKLAGASGTIPAHGHTH